jgi:hypothetical protein
MGSADCQLQVWEQKERLNFPLSIGEWGGQTVDCRLEEGDGNKLNLHWPGNMPKVMWLWCHSTLSRLFPLHDNHQSPDLQLPYILDVIMDPGFYVIFSDHRLWAIQLEMAVALALCCSVAREAAAPHQNQPWIECLCKVGNLQVSKLVLPMFDSNKNQAKSPTVSDPLIYESLLCAYTSWFQASLY